MISLTLSRLDFVEFLGRVDKFFFHHILKVFQLLFIQIFFFIFLTFSFYGTFIMHVLMHLMVSHISLQLSPFSFFLSFSDCIIFID